MSVWLFTTHPGIDTILTGGCCPGLLTLGRSTTGDVSGDCDDSCK